MIPLAEILPAPSGGELQIWLSCATTFLTVACTVKLLFFNKLPNPLETREVDEFVKRDSYNSHCEINRSEHARIEREIGERLEKLKDKHEALACQVSGSERELEQLNARLMQVDQKVDRLLERTK